MFVIADQYTYMNGYSKVCRELGLALSKSIDVAFPPVNDLPPIAQKVKHLVKMIDTTKLTKQDIVLGRVGTNTLLNLKTEARLIGHYALESTILPESMVKEANDDRIEQIWVPSNYCKEVAINNNVIEDKIKVISHGFDQKIFKFTESELHKPFTFLFVGGFNGRGDRKGADLIAEAAKKVKGDFLLKFKINKVYGDASAELMGPHTDIITDDFTDEQMNDVYNSADCFITASQGEAFNMTLLEAMAVGLPCISPINTGERDFASSIDYPLQIYEEVPARYTPWDNGNWFKPSVEEIIERMEQVLEDKPKRRVYDISNYTWEKAAEKCLKCISI